MPISLNAVPEIALLNKQQVAMMIKEARLKKTLTQKELADRAGISLRSLQRIEKADVLLRNYTLHQLAAHVDLSLSLPAVAEEPVVQTLTQLSTARKWILSFSSFACFVFWCLRFAVAYFSGNSI